MTLFKHNIALIGIVLLIENLLEVFIYIGLIYKLHIKNRYITYKELYSKQMLTISINMKGLQEH